jgi:uridine kinase
MGHAAEINMDRPSVLVALVGGSGSGKSWLASRLQSHFSDQCGLISLDDFYLDRSHLSLAQRARLNFDHPRAIDWPRFHEVLRQAALGRTATVPIYDFCTHARAAETRRLLPAPILLVDGLWLLKDRSLRGRFIVSVFLDCPPDIRLARRLSRDCLSRGRTQASIQRQFRAHVEPMHQKFVEPQKKWAQWVLAYPIQERSLKPVVETIEHAVRERTGRTASAGA